MLAFIYIPIEETINIAVLSNSNSPRVPIVDTSVVTERIEVLFALLVVVSAIVYDLLVYNLKINDFMTTVKGFELL